MLIAQAADVAKGARFYIDNWGCDEVLPRETFATACFGLIAFALDAVDVHYCALDEQHKLPRDNADMKLEIDYSGNE